MEKVICCLCKKSESQDKVIPLTKALQDEYFVKDDQRLNLENAENSFICASCQISLSNIPNANFEDNVISDINARDYFDIYVFQALTVELTRNKQIDLLCHAFKKNKGAHKLEDNRYTSKYADNDYRIKKYTEEEIKFKSHHLEDEEIHIKCDVRDFGVDTNGTLKDDKTETNTHQSFISQFQDQFNNDSSLNLPYYINKYGTRIYKCHQCIYKTTKELQCIKHLLTHKTDDNAAIFKCDDCSFESKYKSSLKKHSLLHRNEPKSEYKCNNCNFQTQYNNHLERHLLVHKKEDEVNFYKCHNCTFKTKYKHNIIKHVLTHQTEKTFKCPKCPYETNHTNIYRIHLSSHKNVDKVPFKCKKCSYKTSDAASLKYHTSTHKKEKEEDVFYICSECQFKTKYKRNLITHFITHRGRAKTLRYKCLKCSYMSNRKSGLNTHLLIHKNQYEVTTYRCHICSYKSNRLEHLRAHLLIPSHRRVS